MVVSDIASVGDFISGSSHCSTAERLYAWEKKLFQEVKVNSPEFAPVPTP